MLCSQQALLSLHWYSSLQAVQLEGVHKGGNWIWYRSMCSQDLSAALIFKWLLPANSAASRALLIPSEFISLHRYSLDQKNTPEDCSWRIKSSLTDVFLLLVNPCLSQLLAKQRRQGLLHHHITFSHVTEHLQAPLELAQEVFREQSKDPSSLDFFLGSEPISANSVCWNLSAYWEVERSSEAQVGINDGAHNCISEFLKGEGSKDKEDATGLALCMQPACRRSLRKILCPSLWITKGIELNLSTCREENLEFLILSALAKPEKNWF